MKVSNFISRVVVFPNLGDNIPRVYLRSTVFSAVHINTTAQQFHLF